MLTRKFGWDAEGADQAIRTLENAATVIEPPRLEEVIEGGHADNRCWIARWLPMPTIWSPETGGTCCPWGSTGDAASSMRLGSCRSCPRSGRMIAQPHYPNL